jgi:hypothetical protein
MTKNRYIGAAIVFTITTLLFSFEKRGSGKIYCIDPSNPPPTGKCCPIETLIEYVPDPVSGVTNPCPSTRVPYICTTVPTTQCVPANSPKYKMVDD